MSEAALIFGPFLLTVLGLAARLAYLQINDVTAHIELPRRQPVRIRRIDPPLSKGWIK